MKGRLLTSLITVMVLSGIQAQEVPAVPKLVVGLTIDQLRMDYVEAFSLMYGERGFKRLLKLNAKLFFFFLGNSKQRIYRHFKKRCDHWQHFDIRIGRTYFPPRNSLWRCPEFFR